MKIETYREPKSSFLGIEKDLNIIISRMLKNQRLKKLLYYTTPDCLTRPTLSEKQSLELFGHNIRIVPKIEIEPNIENYVCICFDGFVPNATNPEFRDSTIIFDIYCNYNLWHLKDFELRPYKIAAEIDSMLEDTRLTGIGKLEFSTAQFMGINEDYGGLMLIYRVVHGGEDKYNMPNPSDEAALIENFNNIFNNDE